MFVRFITAIVWMFEEILESSPIYNFSFPFHFSPHSVYLPITTTTSMSVKYLSDERESTVTDDITGKEDNFSALRKVASSSQRVVTDEEAVEDILSDKQEEM